MQAITTRFLGPTNFRGSRVKAQCEAGSVIVSWDHALDPEGNHKAACAALLSKLGWHKATTIWHGGCLPDCKGWAFIPVPVDAYYRCQIDPPTK
jgi:hypothetical protein